MNAKKFTVTNITFETKFTTTYLRNNRSSGQKSLRCFPDCCIHKGHEHFGFCGRSIVTVISMRSNGAEVHNFEEDIPLFLIQLRPSREPQFSKYPILSDELLVANIRSNHSKKGQLLAGEAKTITINPQENHVEYNLVVEFNSSLNSWDYGWKSNRWSTDETHLVDLMVLVKSDDFHYNLIAKAESTAFTIVACKTCSKTTGIKVAPKDEKEGNEDVYMNDDDDTPILSSKPKTDVALNRTIQDKLNDWKIEQKANKKKMKNISQDVPDRAEYILGELNNLAKKLIEEPTTAGTASTLLIDDDGSNGISENISTWSRRKTEHDDKLRASASKLIAIGGENGSDNDGSNTPSISTADCCENSNSSIHSAKGKECSNDGPNDALNRYDDRNNKFYFGYDKIDDLLNSVSDKFDSAELDLLKKTLATNQDLHNQAQVETNSIHEYLQDQDQDQPNFAASNDSKPTREDVKKKYIQHLLERARSIGTASAFDPAYKTYTIIVKKDKEKKQKEKKRKSPPPNDPPLKRGRKKTKHDDDDLVYLDNGDVNIYAKKYASKRSRTGEDGHQYDDDDDDNDDDDDFDDRLLSEQEKAKFENFVNLAMESGFFGNGPKTDIDDGDLLDSLQASMSTTTSSTVESLNLLSSVSMIRAEKYRFDKNKVLFGFGSNNPDFTDAKRSSDPIMLPTMAH